MAAQYTPQERRDWLQIRSKLLAFANNQTAVHNAVEKMRINLHGGQHHMAGFNGALRCIIATTPTRTDNNVTRLMLPKTQSSYFTENTDTEYAVMDALLQNNFKDGRNTINVVAGFLLKANPGDKITLTAEAQETDPEYGYTIRCDPSSTDPNIKKLTELEARNAVVIIQKEPGFGEFSIFNAYPTIDHEDTTITPDNTIRDDMLKSPSFSSEISTIEKVYWMSHTFINETSPTLTLHKPVNNKPYIDFNFPAAPDTTIRFTETGIRTLNPDATGKEIQTIIKDLNLEPQVKAIIETIKDTRSQKDLDTIKTLTKEQTKNYEMFMQT